MALAVPAVAAAGGAVAMGATVSWYGQIKKNVNSWHKQSREEFLHIQNAFEKYILPAYVHPKVWWWWWWCFYGSTRLITSFCSFFSKKKKRVAHAIKGEE